MRVKMSKQPQPAPTARAVGPCPSLIQTSRMLRHWKLTQDHRTTRPPPLITEDADIFIKYKRNATIQIHCDVGHHVNKRKDRMWLGGYYGLNGPSRQYISLCQAVKRNERRENCPNNATRSYCKRSRPYSNPNH